MWKIETKNSNGKWVDATPGDISVIREFYPYNEYGAIGHTLFPTQRLAEEVARHLQGFHEPDGLQFRAVESFKSFQSLHERIEALEIWRTISILLLVYLLWK